MSRDNFGEQVSLLAAAALVVDYTLTVAVSIAAGTAALTSALPRLIPATVPLCLAILAVITVLNLRGLGDAARAFLLLTMVFIVGLLAIIAIGLVHPLFKPPRVRRAKLTELLPRRDPAMLLSLPVLASLLATNNHLPHLYALRDDRQVFASGIWTLAVLSGTLLVAVRESRLAARIRKLTGVWPGEDAGSRSSRLADP